MSSSSQNPDSTGAAVEDATVDVPSTDPPPPRTASTRELRDQNRQTRPPRGRSHKRDHSASDDTTSSDGRTSRPKKKPTARKANKKRATKKRVDIDRKHAHDPQFAANIAESVYDFLRHTERTVLPGEGQTLHTAKPYENLRELRTRCINSIYNYNNMRRHCPEMQVPTDTIHLAIYIFDRFVERYADKKNFSLNRVMATALFLASKYEDVDPVCLDAVIVNGVFGRQVTDKEVLSMEVTLSTVLHILMGPTATAFTHRYLQAVDLETNVAAVRTARYFCALGVAHYDFTGQYYSRIAAAAAFIAYNKYAPAVNASVNDSTNTAPPGIEYPEILHNHSDYSAKDLGPIVKELLALARRVEEICLTNNTRHIGCYRDAVPVDIYLYYKRAGVVATKILPDFNAYYKKLNAEESASCSETEGSKASPPEEDITA